MVPESFASYMTTMHLSQNVISFIWPEKFAHGRVKGNLSSSWWKSNFFCFEYGFVTTTNALQNITPFHAPTILSLPKLVIALS